MDLVEAEKLEVVVFSADVDLLAVMVANLDKLKDCDDRKTRINTIQIGDVKFTEKIELLFGAARASMDDSEDHKSDEDGRESEEIAEDDDEADAAEKKDSADHLDEDIDEVKDDEAQSDDMYLEKISEEVEVRCHVVFYLSEFLFLTQNN
jgi:hypothetical protein